MRPIAVALCVLLAACDAAEREELRAQLDVVEKQKLAAAEALATAQRETAAERDRVKALEDEAKTREREAAEAEANSKATAAKAEKTALDAQREELRKLRQSLEKELENVKLHRDELVEWIESELLPVAEEKDPRLANLRDATKEIAAQVETVRGLRWKHPFMRRLIRREQVGEWMRRDQKRDFPEEEATKLVRVGAAFGLVDEKTDLFAAMTEMLESGAAAFYNPQTGTFYVIEGNDGRGARPVIFHELVHALEDQYFDLTAFDKAVEDDWDAQLARKGLVEGSACHFAAVYERSHPDEVATMNEAAGRPELAQKQIKAMGTVPPMLMAGFALYPYKNAPAWMEAIHADDSAALEKLYADPPVSTEQVLHPEKFPLEGPRDYPHKVGAPEIGPVLGSEWELVDSDDIGELTAGVLLTQLRWERYGPTLGGIVDPVTEGVGFKAPVQNAVLGWDGDRYSAFRNTKSGAVVVVWVSVWDSPEDAREFAETYGDLLGRHVLGKEFTARPSPIRYESPTTHALSAIDLEGTRVVAVLGAPADHLAALLSAGAATKVEADPRDPNDK